MKTITQVEQKLNGTKPKYLQELIPRRSEDDEENYGVLIDHILVDPGAIARYDAVSTSKYFAIAHFYISCGLFVFPADSSFARKDASRNLDTVVNMWTDFPNSVPAIATGRDVGIVAIEIGSFIDLQIEAFKLNAQNTRTLPISQEERATLVVTQFCARHVERESWSHDWNRRLEAAYSAKDYEAVECLREECDQKNLEYGEDKRCYLFRIDPSLELPFPSSERVYADGSFVIAHEDSITEHAAPKPLHRRIVDYCIGSQTFDPDIEITPPSYAEREFECNDDGNAKRFVMQHRDRVRYCVEAGHWFVFDGKRWKPDNLRYVDRLAKETVRSIALEAGRQELDDKTNSDLLKHAQRSKSAKAIKDMKTLAESDLAIRIARFDRDPWLLNCANGTLDLRTAKVRLHDKDDFITKIINVEYHRDASCPTWLSFLSRITNDNQTLIYFLRRSVGYWLTGESNERAVFILYGSGANGKSVFVETILGLMNDYATVLPSSAVMKKQSGAATNDVAKLIGARFAAVNETDEGGRLDEATIKAISGNDTLSARKLYQEFVDFRPQAKLCLRTNHKPTVQGIDEGIWDRLKLIPFTVRIPPSEQDKQLMKKLRAEFPGILAWAVVGCRDWQSIGLGVPEEVVEATNAYQKEQDTFAQFLETACELTPDAWTPSSEIRVEYERFCNEIGAKPLSKQVLPQRLKQLNCVAASRRRKGEVVRGWLGIGLRVPQGSDAAVDDDDIVDSQNENSSRETE